MNVEKDEHAFQIHNRIWKDAKCSAAHTYKSMAATVAVTQRRARKIR